MFCGKCGNKIENGELFCGKCGNKIYNDGVNNGVMFNPTPINNNNNSISDSNRTMYGILSILIGIGTIFSSGFMFFVDLKSGFSVVTFLILFTLEGLGLFFGIKGKSGGRVSGVILNIIAVFTTFMLLLFVLLFYGVSKIRMP